MAPGINAKPVYLRGLPRELIREAKALAARRGVTLAAIVIDSLARTIREEQGARAAVAASVPNQMMRARRWFEGQCERLSHEIGGQYAAIIDDAVFDHDADFDALAQRVFARLGARDVFMPLVPLSDAQVQPLRVRSPRLRSVSPSSRKAPHRPSDGDSTRPGPARGRARGPR